MCWCICLEQCVVRVRHNVYPIAYYYRAYSEDQSFNDDPVLHLPESYDINWMKSIDNNKKLTSITIPGTHDTGALRGYIAGDFAICQVWSVADQLKAGIRYLDLRVKKNLEIVHGRIPQDITFTEVLDQVQSFLKNHSSEAVLIRVKPEGSNKGKVQTQVQNVIKGQQNIWVTSDIPTMGEARGKVILLQKNEFTLGIPTFGTDQPDDYKVSDLEMKKEKIKQHLTEAKEKCGHQQIILSYSSGTGLPKLQFHLTPKEIAKVINPWLNGYLNQLRGSCFGVIAMDFPHLGLIKKTTEMNTV
ncbi:hypothetical protein ACEWY4_000867 [Coilia grayii]|uniref:Phosphatidylinositol-specific phospholipase C X domain-containing protein n=1 Tax=Coilia grayii TaxID=363190 RepID=A0ABD1KXX7_9TELE